MENREIAIVGIFFDGYYDIWEDFLELFTKNWPDCPYDLYIVNNSKELAFTKKYDVKVFHAGEKAEYSDRVRCAIDNIDAEYYLLLLEDFFIGEKLNKDVLSNVMSYIETNGVKYYRMPLSEFVPKGKKGVIEDITCDFEYTISCQPSIWKKEFLKKCIGTDSYNAWVFEGIYTKSKTAHTDKFLSGCVIDYRNCLNLWHGALQGKFLNSTYNHFAQDGYKFKANLDLLDLKTERKHHLKQLFKDTCPLTLQRIIKQHMKTSSVVEKYSEMIDEQIMKMNL